MCRAPGRAATGSTRWAGQFAVWIIVVRIADGDPEHQDLVLPQGGVGVGPPLNPFGVIRVDGVIGVEGHTDEALLLVGALLPGSRSDQAKPSYQRTATQTLSAMNVPSCFSVRVPPSASVHVVASFGRLQNDRFAVGRRHDGEPATGRQGESHGDQDQRSTTGTQHTPPLAGSAGRVRDRWAQELMPYPDTEFEHVQVSVVGGHSSRGARRYGSEVPQPQRSIAVGPQIAHGLPSSRTASWPGARDGPCHHHLTRRAPPQVADHPGQSSAARPYTTPHQGT